MRPLLKTAIAFCLPALPAAFLASTLGLTSCAEDGCVVDPSDPRCASLPMSDLTLLTSRLDKTAGGTLTATIRNHQADSRVEAELGSSDRRVTFKAEGDNWVADISPSLLSSIPPGALNVTLFADGKQITKVVRIYVRPDYREASRATQNLAASGRTPTWVQFSQGKIFAASDSPSNRRVDEYSVSGTTFTLQPLREAFFGSIPLTTILDVSETSALKLDNNGPTANLVFGSLDNTTFLTQGFQSIKSLTHTKSGTIAVERTNMQVAVSGEGADGPLKVYSVSLAAAMTTVTNPQQKLATQLAWGRIDNNQELDLVALHADGTFAVYLQKGTTGLTYDSNFSSGLQTAAALQAGAPVAIAVGDVDRDGIDDVMIAQNMQVTPLASEGDGKFAKHTGFGGMATDAIAVGDGNGDGKADIVVASKTPMATLYFYPNQAP